MHIILISFKTTVTLPSHLRLDIPSGLFPSCLLTKTLYVLFSPIHATCPIYLLDLITVTILCVQQIMKRHIILTPKHLPLHSILRHHQPTVLPNVTGNFTHTHTKLAFVMFPR